MENPFLNQADARKNDCFTNLESAKVAAKADLRARIAELQEALDRVDSTTPDNVYSMDVPSIFKTY
jgi:hypothetical protein